MGIRESLDQIRQKFDETVNGAAVLQQLEDLRVAFLGKKGELTGVLRGMGSLTAEERPAIGQKANEIRAHMEQKLAEKVEELKKKAQEEKLKKEAVDVTMPGTVREKGALHPINQIIDEMKELFIGMGYTVADGPEIEYDYYNFEALNLPEGHPARDTQDTFYITDKMLLRTQTSSVQIHVMEHNKPPCDACAYLPPDRGARR